MAGALPRVGRGGAKINPLGARGAGGGAGPRLRSTTQPAPRRDANRHNASVPRPRAVLLLQIVLSAACTHCVPAPAAPTVVARPYGSRVPSKIDPTRAYPLVVLLHGLGGDGARVVRFFGFDELVDKHQ